MNLGMLFRVTFCLAMLLGHANVSSEEAGGEYRESDSSVPQSVPELAGQSPGLKSAGRVARGDDRSVEDGADISGMSTEGDGRATVPVAEGTGGAVDGTGQDSAKVGACVGARFKKCR